MFNGWRELINHLRALFTTRKPVVERVGLNEVVLEALALSRSELDGSHVTVHYRSSRRCPR